MISDNIINFIVKQKKEAFSQGYLLGVLTTAFICLMMVVIF